MNEYIKKLKYEFENDETYEITKDGDISAKHMGLEWLYPFTINELTEAYYITESFLDEKSAWLRRRGLSDNIGIIPLHQNLRRFVNHCKCGEYNFVTAIYIWDYDFKLLKKYKCSNCETEIKDFSNIIVGIESDEITKMYLELIQENMKINPNDYWRPKIGYAYDVIKLYDPYIDNVQVRKNNL